MRRLIFVWELDADLRRLPSFDARASALVRSSFPHSTSFVFPFSIPPCWCWPPLRLFHTTMFALRTLTSLPRQFTQHRPVVVTQQERYRSNRSRRGLYDGKDIRSGNNVSFSMKATKRTFKPNVFIKRVYSEILDEMIPFHLTASTLRSIDKMGGLDEYLLRSKKVTEGEGLVVKKKILRRLKNTAEIEAKRAATNP